jgi:hypothetical protein
MARNCPSDVPLPWAGLAPAATTLMRLVLRPAALHSAIVDRRGRLQTRHANGGEPTGAHLSATGAEQLPRRPGAGAPNWVVGARPAVAWGLSTIRTGLKRAALSLRFRHILSRIGYSGAAWVPRRLSGRSWRLGRASPG